MFTPYVALMNQTCHTSTTTPIFFTFCNFAAITWNPSPTEKGNSFQLVQTVSQKTTRNYKEKKITLSPKLSRKNKQWQQCQSQKNIILKATSSNLFNFPSSQCSLLQPFKDNSSNNISCYSSQNLLLFFP